MRRPSAAAVCAVFFPVRKAGLSSAAAVGAALLALLLQGCSSGSGAPRNEEPPAVVLTSSSPSDGALGVAKNTQVTLTFSGPLDEASVNASVISLRCTGTYTGDHYWDVSESLTSPAVVPVTVSYAASSRTITVAPRTPLAVRRNCVLDTQGLRDTGGHAVAASVSFRTLANPMTRRESYDPSGVIWGWNTYDHDAVGNVVRGVYYRGSGGDGEWLTADDEVSSVWASAFDGAGNWTRRSDWLDPGADLGWFTADDGPPSDLGIAVFDERSRVQRLEQFDGPGADGQPFTADDLPSMWSEIVRSAEGDVVAEKFHYYPGLDATWFTADDPTSVYDGFAYDAPGGRLRRLTTVSDAGPDRVWLTDDDVPDNYYTYGYDAAGLHDTTVSVTGAGPDAVWFTADDVIQSCQRVSYDDQRLPTRFVWYSVGLDGSCFTPDDEFYSYRALTYASNGGAKSEVWYFAPGPDGQWLTSDDIPTWATWFDSSL